MSLAVHLFAIACVLGACAPTHEVLQTHRLTLERLTPEQSCTRGVSAARASASTGTIRIVLCDSKLHEPLVGVTVVAEPDVKTGLTDSDRRAEITDDAGTATITLMSPGNYKLTLYYGDLDISAGDFAIAAGSSLLIIGAVDSTRYLGEVII